MGQCSCITPKKTIYNCAWNGNSAQLVEFRIWCLSWKISTQMDLAAFLLTQVQLVISWQCGLVAGSWKARWSIFSLCWNEHYHQNAKKACCLFVCYMTIDKDPLREILWNQQAHQICHAQIRTSANWKVYETRHGNLSVIWDLAQNKNQRDSIAWGHGILEMRRTPTAQSSREDRCVP